MYQILVAEEDAIDRQTLCACLEKQFGEYCMVLSAGSGTEAVELFERYCPQVVILNVNLPGLSGLEAARRIRQSGSACGILFLTDCDNFSLAREAILLRAVDCLPKPWSEEELAQAVGAVLRLLGEYGEALDACLLTGEGIGPGEQSRTSHRLEKVREGIDAFIRDHYATDLSMQSVARAMNYSDAYFCKLFKQCFEVNFSAYLNEYRIDRAKELLQSTRLNVREVSTACGYSDSNYFTRVFKRITGRTPSEYRAS